MATKLIKGLTAAQKKELQRVCEDLFERYRYFKLVEAENDASGRLDLNESAYEIEQSERRKMLIQRLEQIVERLPLSEKDMIKLRYMDSDEARDYQIYQIELGIAEGTYTKIRTSAFFKLAGAFKLDFGADPIEVPNI
ncbi:hypothetical protein [Cohnella herbarum]|uniref:ArpU family transcriptional regulator n=1 Tax=Cohnella herbarum TaxID=2728023 RepID=A0A7Z2ZPQ6_9BACL|nr:hypothetical protein [Cohnella herbarum]QJD87593.1 hypothetical protein HH215_33375 [Cohnella herbarum]